MLTFYFLNPFYSLVNSYLFLYFLILSTIIPPNIILNFIYISTEPIQNISKHILSATKPIITKLILKLIKLHHLSNNIITFNGNFEMYLIPFKNLICKATLETDNILNIFKYLSIYLSVPISGGKTN